MFSITLSGQFPGRKRCKMKSSCKREINTAVKSEIGLIRVSESMQKMQNVLKIAINASRSHRLSPNLFFFPFSVHLAARIALMEANVAFHDA